MEQGEDGRKKKLEFPPSPLVPGEKRTSLPQAWFYWDFNEHFRPILCPAFEVVRASNIPGSSFEGNLRIFFFTYFLFPKEIFMIRVQPPFQRAATLVLMDFFLFLPPPDGHNSSGFYAGR